MYRCCPEMPAIRRMLETGEPGYGFREELTYKRKGRQILLQNLPAASESKSVFHGNKKGNFSNARVFESRN